MRFVRPFRELSLSHRTVLIMGKMVSKVVQRNYFGANDRLSL